MAFRDILLPEFDQEMAKTRTALERVPNDKFAWKPHQKSFSMGHLATHLSNIPTWTGHTLKLDEFDIQPKDGEPPRTTPLQSTKEVLAQFDKNVADARAAIANAADELFSQNWTLLAGGNAVFTLPKMAVLRSFVLSHIIHHRAQLCVYLRLNDIPVPSIYGPSADESGM